MCVRRMAALPREHAAMIRCGLCLRHVGGVCVVVVATDDVVLVVVDVCFEEIC